MTDFTDKNLLTSRREVNSFAFQTLTWHIFDLTEVFNEGKILILFLFCIVGKLKLSSKISTVESKRRYLAQSAHPKTT